jgi:hypothetical protein
MPASIICSALTYTITSLLLSTSFATGASTAMRDICWTDSNAHHPTIATPSSCALCACGAMFHASQTRAHHSLCTSTNTWRLSSQRSPHRTNTTARKHWYA